MKKLLRTLAWTAGVLLVLGVVLALGGWFLVSRFAPADGPLEVWTQPVTRGDLTETVSAPGEVRPVTKVELSARVSARIQALPFKEGDRVEAGDTLLELDSSDLRAQLEGAAKRRAGLVASLAVERARIQGLEASLESARAAAEEAARDLERQETLRGTGDVSSRTFEQARQAATAAEAAAAGEEAALEAARLNLDVTRFNVESADADIRRFEDNLAYTTMASPIDGVVTRVNVEVGEIAITGTMNNPGTVLLEVADLSGLVVVARVDEADVSRVAVGQPAEVRLPAFPDGAFAGEVERVALATPRASSGSASGGLGLSAPSYETRIRLTTLPDPVRTGLSATVEIEAAVHEGVLLVPNQSVFSVPVEALGDARGEDPTRTYSVGGRQAALAVYAVVDGRTDLVPVEIGASDADRTVVTRGLDEGVAVVTGPFTALDLLEDALPVAVVSEGGLPEGEAP